MYIPKHYEIKEQESVFRFIRMYPFALLVHYSETYHTTHLPFLLTEMQGVFQLKSHLAKANPHWQELKKASEVLLVFTGPSAYISPSWYKSKVNVPTWNYTAVHVYASLKIIDNNEQLTELMKETIVYFEPEFEKQFEQLPSSYTSAMMNEIVGIELKIKRWEAKFKLSQNKSDEELEKVFIELEQKGQNDLVRMMKQFRS